MNVFKLSLKNAKSQFKDYGSYVASLAFTVAILYNFLFIVFSDSMKILQDWNKQFIDTIVIAISFILVIFTLFFIWYTNNIFIKKRKKEIGMLIFMGLDNKDIGAMLAIENFMISMSALVIGISTGILFSKFFIMLVLKLAAIPVSIQFSISLKTVVITSLVFMVLFLIFSLKGYVSIVRSSVKEMIQASKKLELVSDNKLIMTLKLILGVTLLGLGYYFATKIGLMTSFLYMILAVVFVIVGIYLVYEALLPKVLQLLVSKKKQLYTKTRIMWQNNLLYKIKRNYRSYAIVTALMISAFAVFSTATAINTRADEMGVFDEVFHFQLISDAEIDEKALDGLTNIKTVKQIKLRTIATDRIDTVYQNSHYLFMSLEDYHDLGGKVSELDNNELIELRTNYIFSLSSKELKPLIVDGEKKDVVESNSNSVMGLIQRHYNIYVINQSTYDSFSDTTQELSILNIKQNSMESYQDNRMILDGLENTKILTPDYEQKSMAFIRVLYAISMFLFVVLIAASSSIIFIKVFEDIKEDHDRIVILQKIGVANKTIYNSVKQELLFIFVLPFLFTCITSFFIMDALGNLMITSLYSVGIKALLFVFVVYLMVYIISCKIYKNNVI